VTDEGAGNIETTPHQSAFGCQLLLKEKPFLKNKPDTEVILCRVKDTDV